MEDLIGFQGKGFVSIFMIVCLAFPFPLMLDRSSIDWVFFFLSAILIPIIFLGRRSELTYIGS